MRIDPNTRYLLSLPSIYTLGSGEQLLLEAEPNFRLLLIADIGYELHSPRGICSVQGKAGLYLVPTGEMCHLYSTNEALEVLILSFKAHPRLCNAECLQRSLVKNLHKTSKYNSIKSRPRRSKPSISYLPMSYALQIWLDSVLCLRTMLEADLQHFDLKLEELFALLRLAYDREEIEGFLKFYHCRIDGFRERIVSAYRTDMEVSDLYRLGEQMGLKEMSFKRSFYDEFAMPPREWLVEQRAKAIYRELVMSNRPLKELSYAFGFCSVSHFGLFCRQTLGDTPMHIRKGLLNRQ